MLGPDPAAPSAAGLDLGFDGQMALGGVLVAEVVALGIWRKSGGAMSRPLCTGTVVQRPLASRTCWWELRLADKLKAQLPEDVFRYGQ